MWHGHPKAHDPPAVWTGTDDPLAQRTASQTRPTPAPPEVATQRRTYALKLAYDGARFRGWQRQPGQPSVQQALEDALATLLGEQVRVYGASRTDAGVHAEGQVASFTTRLAVAPSDVLRGLCVEGVRILDLAEAAPSFHARASAAGKRYRYRFGKGSQRAWDLGRAALDWEKARTALQGLHGLPHLAGLSSPSSSRNPAPPLDEWSLCTLDAGAELDVRARAFRRHQVRNLAGHLAAVALGLAPPESLASLAAARRPWHGATAPPHGLTLVEVVYPPALDPFSAAAETAAGRGRLPR